MGKLNRTRETYLVRIISRAVILGLVHIESLTSSKVKLKQKTERNMKKRPRIL